MIHDKLKVKAYLHSMIAICALVHVVVGIYFAYLGIYPIVVLSLIDVAVYAVAFFVNSAGKTRLAGFIITVKVITYSLLATYLFGVNVNAHWLSLVIIVPVALHLDFTKLQRVLIVGCIPVVINAQLLFTHTYYAPFDMSYDVFLGMFFINVVVLGFIATILIDAVITQKIEEMYKKEINSFKHISNIDPLTGLNNRRYAEAFFEKIGSDEQRSPFFFCLMDIDNFKSVNDTYGHDAGDVVLKCIAEILRKNARQTDLVCRWGGEEFLVGLSKCNPEKGLDILEKIRKIVENEIIVTDAGDIKVTITGGASALIGNDMKAVLADCDKKLYDGKRSGKNKIVI